MFNLVDNLTEQRENNTFSHFKSNPNLVNLNGIDFNNNNNNNKLEESRSLDQPLFDSFFSTDSSVDIGMDHLNFNQDEDIYKHRISKMNTSESFDSQPLMENHNYNTNNSPSLIMSPNGQQNYYSSYTGAIPASNNHGGFVSQQQQQQQHSMPSFLSSSFTSNSCHHAHTVNKSNRFGSNASSLSSNILLSSSSSSFSSFSSNFSNESALIKYQQKSLQQQYQSAFAPAQNLEFQNRNVEYSNQLALPPPASTLAMHRASLPIAFQSTRTLTDIVSLEHLTNNNLYSNHQFSSLDFRPTQDSTAIDNTLVLSAETATSFTSPKSESPNTESHSHNCTSPEANSILRSDTNNDSSHSTSLRSDQKGSPLVQADLTEDFAMSPKTTDLIEMECNNLNTVPLITQQTPVKYAPSSLYGESNFQQVGGVSGNSHSLNNSQISMMIQTATGYFSRSNSQPDLTQLNSMEKPVPNHSSTYNNNNYCCYFNSSNNPNSTSSGNVYSSNFNNCFNVNTSSAMNQSYVTNSNNNMVSNNNSLIDNATNRQKLLRRHPSLIYKNSMCEYQEQDESDFLADFNIIDYLNNSNQNSQNNAHNYNVAANANISSLETNDLDSFNLSSNNNQSGMLNNNGRSLSTDNRDSLENKSAPDDGLFLGTDALTDFLSNCGTLSDLFDDLPEIEDLMSLVTFESSTSNNLSLDPVLKQTQCDMVLPNYRPVTTNNTKEGYPLSNYYDYCNADGVNHNCEIAENESTERTTKSAPPSPTPQNKKQRPTTNIQMWANKTWNKMDDLERSKAVDCLTRIINDDMGLREQLEIIRILNPDAKLKPTDKQFVINLKIIDDDKFKRIKDVIKAYGLFANEHQFNDNSSDCSANSCPQSYHLAKRELRLKRAQQRLKLKIKKEHRQIIKESKSGLFTNTEVIPLSQVLPEEDIEVDILS